MLIGFGRGKRVLVTYYRQLRTGGTNLRNNVSDYPTSRNVIDNEYQKILNLEITLPQALDFENNPEQASIGVSGEAMFYPNMNPSNGDVFTMGLGDGRIGVFQISSVAKTSWRTSSVYAVKFTLQSFAQAEDIDPIEGAVTITSVFSKENYLGGTAALLSEVTYLQLEKLKVTRSNLLKYYHHHFFFKNLNSYLRPDGIYDPYVVKFVADKLTMADVHTRPKLLTGGIDDSYRKTIFGRLVDRFNNSLYNLADQYRILPYKQTRMGVYVTELSGYALVSPEVGLEDQEPYVFTSAFYTNNTADMTNEEKRFHDAITLRKAGDLTTLISDYLDPIFSLSDDDKFYKIPLYVHLIDMALQSEYREIDAPSMNYASTGG